MAKLSDLPSEIFESIIAILVERTASPPELWQQRLTARSFNIPIRAWLFHRLDLIIVRALSKKDANERLAVLSERIPELVEKEPQLLQDAQTWTLLVYPPGENITLAASLLQRLAWSIRSIRHLNIGVMAIRNGEESPLRATDEQKSLLNNHTIDSIHMYFGGTRTYQQLKLADSNLENNDMSNWLALVPRIRQFSGDRLWFSWITPAHEAPSSLYRIDLRGLEGFSLSIRSMTAILTSLPGLRELLFREFLAKPQAIGGTLHKYGKHIRLLGIEFASRLAGPSRAEGSLRTSLWQNQLEPLFRDNTFETLVLHIGDFVSIMLDQLSRLPVAKEVQHLCILANSNWPPPFYAVHGERDVAAAKELLTDRAMFPNLNRVSLPAHWLKCRNYADEDGQELRKQFAVIGIQLGEPYCPIPKLL